MNADYTVPVLPFLNVTCYLKGLFWADRGDHPHRGIDLATSGSRPLYSILSGTVLQNAYNSSLGNYITVKDYNTGIAYRYCHMKNRSPKAVGSSVALFEYVGDEGRTGSATGIHLHLEMKNMSNTDTWVQSNNRSDYINPCDYLGFPNTHNISIYCNGTSPPPPPTTKKNKFPWVLYAKKFRSGIR